MSRPGNGATSGSRLAQTSLAEQLPSEAQLNLLERIQRDDIPHDDLNRGVNIVIMRVLLRRGWIRSPVAMVVWSSSIRPVLTSTGRAAIARGLYAYSK